MVYAYSGNVVFQLLAFGRVKPITRPLFVVCAVISGGLSGANFPMTAALVADYYGETNNAVNYGSIYAFKALGGSFAGGVRGTDHDRHPVRDGHLPLGASGFFFGATLGALAALTVGFLCKRPTVEQMARAVRTSADKETEQAQPAVA